jgi:hypothetical protein
VKVRKAHKDTARVAAVKKDDTAAATTAPAIEVTPAKAPEAAPSDAAPAK